MASPSSTSSHPYYGPSERLLADRSTSRVGLLSMAAYLLFWAGAVAVGLRVLERKLPAGQPSAGEADPAVAALRLRYAAGAIGREEYLAVLRDLQGAAGA